MAGLARRGQAWHAGEWQECIGLVRRDRAGQRRIGMAALDADRTGRRGSDRIGVDD